jgi:hypothetical protein
VVTQPDIPTEPAAEDPRERPQTEPRPQTPDPGGPAGYQVIPPAPCSTHIPTPHDNGQPAASPAWQPPFAQSAYQQQTAYPDPTAYPDQAAYPNQTGYQPPEPRRSLAGSARFWLTVAAAILGVAGLIASAGGLATQLLPRRFSAAQQRQIMAWETASRWRTWPAGKIFPGQVGYQVPGLDFSSVTSLNLTANRVGIAPQTTCQAGTDQALAAVLDAHGCQALLRATYTDATDSFVMTVGVAVMRGTAPAATSLPATHASTHGVQPTVTPVPFRDSLAAGFGDRERQLAGAYSRGPYLILYTAGYTDGRHYDHESLDPYVAGEMSSLASGVAQRIGSALGASPRPPTCPGTPGC